MRASEGNKLLNHAINSRSSSAWVILFRERLEQRLYNEFLPLSAYNQQGEFYNT